jgi:hypothetical protein
MDTTQTQREREGKGNGNQCTLANPPLQQKMKKKEEEEKTWRDVIGCFFPSLLLRERGVLLYTSE